MSTETYRATDFMEAARKLGLELVVGLDRPDPLAEIGGGTLSMDFSALDGAVDEIGRLHAGRHLLAIHSVDDSALVLAARANARLGLPANSEESVVSGGNKAVFREIMQAAGLRSPWFRRYGLEDAPEKVAAEVPYPCVLKPLFLNASRGVIRADGPESFIAAFLRIRKILTDPDLRKMGGGAAEELLVESFMPGREVALEGMMVEGDFHLLAFFDKPDPLDGPYFEETVYITPSRLPAGEQRDAVDTVRRGAAALGLRTGPVHAELRLDGGDPSLLEIAPRSIGGHCSRALRFEAGKSLEELILRQAVGLPSGGEEREDQASGVMMIPIPGRGILHGVRGLQDARAVPLVTGVEISIPVSHSVIPLPEGHRYLGFIFARGGTPDAVEEALRAAHANLSFEIRPVAEPGPGGEA